MTCGPSTPACQLSGPPRRGEGRSEVCHDPERIHLGLHRSIDSDRLVNEETRVGDDEDRQRDLQAAREAGAPPEIRERKGTEDQEEQDQDPQRAVVPLERGGRLSGAHDAHSAPRGTSAPEKEQPVKRAALYCRVSTSDQTCDNQLRDLREYCRARGWTDVREFIDTGISGTKERRPALDKMMVEVKARRVDVVVVAAFDRFGRSVRHLVEALELFGHLHCGFVSLREQIDLESPLGTAIFTIIAAIAQLERSLIVERVKAGLRRARAEGKRLGRPRLQVSERQLRIVASQKLPVRAAAKALGVSPSSYLRLVRQPNGSAAVTGRSA